jgi:Pentapeptide repeats (8 copies)
MVMQKDTHTDTNNGQSPVTADEFPAKIVINNHLPVTADKKSEWEKWTAIAGVLIAAVVGISGYFQYLATTAQQKADSADKAIETREQVLSDYSRAIAELMTKNKEETGNEEYISNYNKRNIARGQTFVALRRLNISDGDGKDDASKLKGLLIRYLYELRLIDNYELVGKDVKADEADINLEGANIDNVVLEDAWLPNIDLTGAWLRKGNFRNADLSRAILRNTNLTDADFTGADFTGADLRFAKLTSAILEKTTLTGACYIEGTEAEYFPPSFNPEEYEMVAISKDQSDPNKSNFQPCPPVPLNPTP